MPDVSAALHSLSIVTFCMCPLMGAPHTDVALQLQTCAVSKPSADITILIMQWMWTYIYVHSWTVNAEVSCVCCCTVGTCIWEHYYTNWANCVWLGLSTQCQDFVWVKRVITWWAVQIASHHAAWAFKVAIINWAVCAHKPIGIIPTGKCNQVWELAQQSCVGFEGLGATVCQQSEFFSIWQTTYTNLLHAIAEWLINWPSL